MRYNKYHITYVDEDEQFVKHSFRFKWEAEEFKAFLQSCVWDGERKLTAIRLLDHTPSEPYDIEHGFMFD